MEFFSGPYWIARLGFERALAGIYLLAFVLAYNQFPALLGQKGLSPAMAKLRQKRFRESPTVFYWHYSDRFLRGVTLLGIVLSLVLLLGLPGQGPAGLSMGIWLILWALYLSIVNIGRPFYGFGWESMLLEAGFFAAFLGPTHHEPSLIGIFLLRWMLFRVEFGAGLIKLKHDPCWRDLTCLFYHYETQPLPNPLSWYFHRLPKLVHRCGVLFSHLVQVVVPFGLFAPQPVAAVAAALIVFHQLWLIFSGNYAWLNFLTVALAIPCFPDAFFASATGMGVPDLGPRPLWYEVVLGVLALATVWLSMEPTKNLFSRQQRMNYSYNPLHLVNTYGAFGSVTKKRYEVILEGSQAADPNGAAWRAYEFKAKPGDPARMPPQYAPYHLRLDWMMWFLPFTTLVHRGGVHVSGYEPWFIGLVTKLLRNDKAMLKLLRSNPFPDDPPRFIRARFFLYQFTTYRERKETGNWWKRHYVGEYLPPVSRETLAAVGGA